MLQIFGKNPNQSQIKESINYKEGAFSNIELTMLLTEEASFFKMTKDLIKQNKHRVPNKPIPSSTFCWWKE
jgi:hypothetical protein